MIEKSVNIKVEALDKTATKAVVVEYREAEGIYVFDLYADGELIAKSRYCAADKMPFEMTEDDRQGLMPEGEIVEYREDMATET